MKRLLIVCVLLFMSIGFMGVFQAPAFATVKCCNWYYPAPWPLDAYYYWHPQGPDTDGWRYCYNCGPYWSCYFYNWQNGYWTINVAQVASCSDCPTLASCDQAICQSCASTCLHNGVIRLKNKTPTGEPPDWMHCQGVDKCTKLDRWVPLWACVPCNNF